MISNSSSPTLFKRKRPARLDIPISRGGFSGPPTPAVDAIEVMEIDGDGYSVCCKRGRREAMEDRYSAVVDLQGDPKQVF